MSVPTNPKIEQKQTEVIWKRSRKAKRIELNDHMVKVYVWELPVRIFHWINAFSIIVLMITGVFIGRPFVSASIQEEAYYSFLMGWARYIHFFVAFLFTINLAVRWYWVYKGNEHATSNPFRLSFWKEAFETIKYYLFMKNNKKHYIGHNPLAQLSYWIFIGLGSIIMMLTGYYLLFEPQPESIYGKMFMWVAHLFGGDSYSVRSWHHLVAWGFILFTVVHVYMAFREDYLQRNGTMSSIFTGYKIERKKEALGEHDEK